MTTWMVFKLARRGGTLPASSLLLAGVVLNAILSAGILALTFIVDPTRMFGMMYWLLGTVTPVSGWSLAGTVALAAFLIGALVAQAPKLNLLSLGDEAALSLGLEVERFKTTLLFSVALMMSVVVAVSGLIGFVGIMIPHVLRMVLGPDHRLLLPASALAGAGFLVLADTAARTLLAPTEMPVGVLTALCGGPFFLYLLRTTHGRWLPK